MLQNQIPLSEEDIQKNQEDFLHILSRVQVKGMDQVVQWLQNSSFFRDPASGAHHGDFVGGLCLHSINVYACMTSLCCPDMYTYDEVALVALLHDVCKIGCYKLDWRNKKNENGQWERVPYWKFEDPIPLGHGEKSVMLLQQHGLELTVEQMEAIRWHMGGWDPAAKQMGDVYSRNLLALYLHMADMEATHVMESNLNQVYSRWSPNEPSIVVQRAV